MNSFSPHIGGEEARLQGIASHPNKHPSATREGQAKMAPGSVCEALHAPLKTTSVND